MINNEITNELLILLIDVVIKTHDYQDLSEQKKRLEMLKEKTGWGK